MIILTFVMCLLGVFYIRSGYQAFTQDPQLTEQSRYKYVDKQHTETYFKLVGSGMACLGTSLIAYAFIMNIGYSSIIPFFVCILGDIIIVCANSKYNHPPDIF